MAVINGHAQKSDKNRIVFTYPEGRKRPILSDNDGVDSEDGDRGAGGNGGSSVEHKSKIKGKFIELLPPSPPSPETGLWQCDGYAEFVALTSTNGALSHKRISEQLRRDIWPNGYLHPWGHIDYHRYLDHIEGDPAIAQRQTNNIVIHNDRVYEANPKQARFCIQSFVSKQYSPRFHLLFKRLELVDENLRVDGSAYVLFFDCRKKEFFVRFFRYLPSMRDVPTTWNDGVDIYQFPPQTMCDFLNQGTEGGGMAFCRLSSSPYCLAESWKEDLGMELTVVILCAQWYLDHASAFNLQRNTFTCIQHSVDRFRDLLAGLSCEIWFAARDGLSQSDYARRDSYAATHNRLVTALSRPAAPLLDCALHKGPPPKKIKLREYSRRFSSYMKAIEKVDVSFETTPKTSGAGVKRTAVTYSQVTLTKGKRLSPLLANSLLLLLLC